jgi:ubiquinone biosynthesis protein UbiJ
MRFETPLAAALNHLLKAEPWARERLAPFAGETLELRSAPLPRLRFTVQEAGLVGAVPEAEPALVVTLAPEAPIAFLRGEEHLLKAVAVEGDPKFAEAVMALVRHLRWDAEEDLSRLFGDVAAHRLAQGARDLAAWHRDAGRRLVESFAAYVTEEKQILLARPELEDFSTQVRALRDTVERLQKRIERLG